LTKAYQKEGKYQQALAEIDIAKGLDPARPDIHYLRGRVLLQLGRKEEARKELAEAQRIETTGRNSTATPSPVPSPELLRDSP
jgi:Flp pilus assembly protein TadD